MQPYFPIAAKLAGAVYVFLQFMSWGPELGAPVVPGGADYNVRTRRYD